MFICLYSTPTALSILVRNPHDMCLPAEDNFSSVVVCAGSERGRAEAAEAAVLTVQHKLEALEAAQAQQAEHVQSLGEQVGQRLQALPVLGQYANQASSSTGSYHVC